MFDFGNEAADREDGHPVPTDTASEEGQDGATPDARPHTHDGDSKKRTERRDMANTSGNPNSRRQVLGPFLDALLRRAGIENEGKR